MRCIRLHLTIPDRPAAAVFTTLAAAGHAGVAGRAGTTMVSHWELSAYDTSRFEGSWSCVDDGPDTALTFAGQLDMGGDSPTVRGSRTDAAEPLAARTVIDDTVATVAGLFEGNVRVDDVVIQTHPSTVLPAA